MSALPFPSNKNPMNNSAFAGVVDSFGSFVLDLAPTAAEFLLEKERAKAEEARAKADAEKARRDEAAGRATTGTAGGPGGIPPAYILYGAAALAGIGLAIYLARR